MGHVGRLFMNQRPANMDCKASLGLGAAYTERVSKSERLEQHDRELWRSCHIFFQPGSRNSAAR